MAGLVRLQLTTIALEERYSMQLNYNPKMVSPGRLELPARD